MVEYDHKIEEKMKAMQSEIKRNIQETNSEGKETEGRKTNRSTVWSRRKKETSNWNRIKKQGFKKNEERLRNLQDILKRSNIRIIGVPEGEEEEQKIENLFEQILKENFPSLAKEIDFQEVQEAQRVPKKLDPKRNTLRHITITLPKIKDKKKILEAAREKETVTYKEVPLRLS